MKSPHLKILIALLILALYAGCTSNAEEDIAGKWLMYRVIQDQQDVTSEHDPYDERFIILGRDSTFESGGRPYGRNTGKYVFDLENNTLFLDSDAGPEDDSQWIISIEGDTLHWQGFGSEWANAFEMIHIREK
jgi:hypothetical protein